MSPFRRCLPQPSVQFPRCRGPKDRLSAHVQESFLRRSLWCQSGKWKCLSVLITAHLLSSSTGFSLREFTPRETVDITQEMTICFQHWRASFLCAYLLEKSEKLSQVVTATSNYSASGEMWEHLPGYSSGSQYTHTELLPASRPTMCMPCPIPPTSLYT